jgi:putative membrane protein
MAPQLKRFLLQWIIGTLAVLVATHVVKGISYNGASSLLVATLLLGILNTFVRPLLTLLSLPLVILSLGVFRLFINAALLLLVTHLVPQFHVDNFSAAFWGALVISIITLVLNSLSGTGESRIEVRRGKTPPKEPGNGDGPVIDV